MQVSHNYALEALAALERRPDAIAISSAASVLKNGEVARLVRRFAAHMMARDINCRSCVVIAVPHGPTAFLTAFAAGLIGACWVAYHSRLPMQALRTTHFLHGRDKPGGLKHPGMHEIDDSWWMTEPHSALSDHLNFTGFATPESPAFITKSSGTTGVPKYMIRTCEQHSSFVRRTELLRGAGVCMLFPLTSSLGFRFCVAAMLSGARIVRPMERIGGTVALQRMGVDYVVASPAQVDAICRGAVPPHRIDTLWVGGSIMTPEAARHWLHHFRRVMLMYGAREAAGGAQMTLTEVSDITEIAYSLSPDMKVEIVGEAGELCPHSVPGIVRLRTSTMATGYIGDPEASAEVFREGWFYPGDIGMLTADGRLKILGRVKDQFNLGGVKFNAADVDDAARSVPGIRDAMCFTAPTITGLQQLSLCAVKDPDRDEAAAAAAIRAACRARVRRELLLSAIYFVEALPLNEGGKPIRSQGAQAVSGLLDF